MSKLEPFLIATSEQFSFFDDDQQFDTFKKYKEDIIDEHVEIKKNNNGTWERKEIAEDGHSYSCTKHKTFKNCLTDSEYWSLIDVCAYKEFCYIFYCEDIFEKIFEEDTPVKELIEFCKKAIKELNSTEGPNTNVYKNNQTTVNALKVFLGDNKNSIFNKATAEEKGWLEKFLITHYQK